MKKIFLLVFFILLLNGCANKKFEKETCQQIHGMFTKAVNCICLLYTSDAADD